MNDVKWSYFNKFGKIGNKYMEDNGEGETMGSQIVTAINKLVYKWYNDGDVYDNSYHQKGWLNDLSSYANWLYNYVPQSRPVLNCIEDAVTDYEYELILKELADKFLTEEFLKEYLTKPKTDSIYSAEGKFKYIEDWDEDEEDDDYYDDDYEEDEDEEMD